MMPKELREKLGTRPDVQPHIAWLHSHHRADPLRHGRDLPGFRDPVGGAALGALGGILLAALHKRLSFG